MATTSIQIDTDTRDRLAHLKASPRETYAEVLNKLMSLVPEEDEEGPYTDAFRIGLLTARLDVRSGRTVSHAEMKQRLGL